MMTSKLALAAFSLLAATPAFATPADDLQRLMHAHYQWLLRENPTDATALGVRDYDDRIRDLSPEARAAHVRQAADFLKQIEVVPAAALTPGDRVNRSILIRSLSDTVAEDGFGQRDMLFTTYYGWHQEFADLPRRLPFRTRADYESYLTRIAQYPRLNDQALAITANAVKGGYVLPCSVLGGFERTISGVIAEDPAKSRFYEPFAGNPPVGVGDADWQVMRQRARTIITTIINPAYRRHLDFYLNDYKPHCAKVDSVSALPGGAAWYALQAREQTTTDLAPAQIHAIGLREVERIRGEMDKVARDAGYASREAFIAELRADPKYYPASADQLLREAAWQDKQVDAWLPRLFGRLPRLTFTIRPIPAETAEGTTTAYYNPGSPESGIAGTFSVNTSHLDQRPLWEMPALSLHESVPGHHLQIALQQELDLPPFRRNFVSFTAFTEGWGLYAESLGEEMGLYDTPAKKMGELSYQMWRACRLVVDTGIHAEGWDKARAVAFMRDNTALTNANIDAEVNRYISWPGQALAYMVGRLKIVELRQRAERELEAKFDIRRFHDAVLAQGQCLWMCSRHRSGIGSRRRRGASRPDCP